MAYHNYPDENGATIRLYEDDGRLTRVHAKHWHAFSRLMSRQDDVLLCTYPKSGTHWVWEILFMLRTGTSNLTSEDMKSYLFLSGNPADVDCMPSPRVLASHRQFHDLPTDFIINQRKLVLVFRDPRDVCVSSYHFWRSMPSLGYEGTFDGFIKLFLDGKVIMNSWSRWILSYEKGLKEHPEIPCHVVHYEKLKENPVKEIARLAIFLGVDPSVASTVAEATSFSSMQKYKTQFDLDSMKAVFKGNKANEHVFRRGDSGEWNGMFNQEQLANFNKRLCQQLGRSSVEPLL